MSEMEPALTIWMGPVDANAVGTVHGGVVLRLIDEAGGLAAIGSRQRIVNLRGVGYVLRADDAAQ